MNHHPHESTLMAYAMGTASEAQAVLVACHLTLCPVCRRTVGDLEAIGGAGLEASTPLPADDLLEQVLAQLDDADPTLEAAYDEDGVLPSSIARLVGSFSELPWRWRAPGVEEVTVPDVQTDGMPLRLFRLRPGSVVPAHRHRGQETTLVFTGGFTDEQGHFTRGDVADRGEEGIHTQRIDEGEPCVVLVAADHPLVPLTLRGRFMKWFRDF